MLFAMQNIIFKFEKEQSNFSGAAALVCYRQLISMRNIYILYTLSYYAPCIYITMCILGCPLMDILPQNMYV